MALRKTVSQTALSLRALIQRFALLLLVVAAAGVMLIGKADSALMERTRALALDIAAPALEAISRPVARLNQLVADVQEVANLRTENERLREENARLMAWQNAARRLESENAGLRELLKFREGPPAAFVSARVVADSGHAFVRSALVNVGRRAGVAPGHAVLTGEGLAGRITEVGENSARVLFVTDISSRLPVFVERTRERAILAGDNSAQPRLALSQPVAGLQVGDRIVTSGHGGSFPAGIPIGVVSVIGESGVRVRPLADLGRLEYVRIADYGVTGLVGPVGPGTRSPGGSLRPSFGTPADAPPGLPPSVAPPAAAPPPRGAR